MNTEFEGTKKPWTRCSQVHGTRMLNNLHSSEVKESWLQETIASIEVSP